MAPEVQSPLWTPSPERIANANMTAFMKFVNEQHGKSFANYDDLYRWSIDQLEDFWAAVWTFCGVIAETRGNIVLADKHKMPGARFFPEAKLNFAENLLKRRDDTDAIIFWGEDKVRRHLSSKELYDTVSRFAQALAAEGVGEGDRVAGFMPNMPESVIAMLATASLGATWTSCSPDFGVQGVCDRFGQVEPKVLVCCDGYYYNNKMVETLPRIAEIVGHLPSVKRVVVIPYISEVPDASKAPRAVNLAEFVAPFAAGDIVFHRMPFNHPLYILYSSGTTGVPKCIVHGAGGVLLMHLKEHILQCDVKPGDRVFYFTTCGWMMWNWLVSGLAANAALLLYDGSPFLGRGNVLFDFAAAEDMTHFGTSAKFIDAIAKVKVEPQKNHRLPELRVLLSTGSPLAPEGFDYVYEKVKKDVNLASISGGTDLVACFAGGCPIRPVWRGEIQCRMLGMKVEVFDENARPVVGEKGELVCTAPFPTMPLGFWNDPGDVKYRAAYYDKYENVWRHGDWCEITKHDGLIIYGRSDAVLNPGGVRIGTAEIYRQVEKLEEVVESIVIGQDWLSDVRVVLFVRLREGLALDDALAKRIREVIRDNTTSRHVPAVILQVPDIPRTKSNKIVELAVRAIVHGEPVKNVEALANPEALEHYRNRSELAS
ncbi:acetoacetate--CoA ligase [Usitatibacter palustris]|uniref:Acetyl-coenzyme A synthetase n=1 Tax=Usitatibacter palustris TaxID=2732487 RepID=A0A6M4H4G6_9PROT|nr:acetoacetate--CoA ligase [Usitatibacter palustris]QJR14172.1 Acetyl-coenzyme A synthetase [Usitatibacter palustris]